MSNSFLRMKCGGLRERTRCEYSHELFNTPKSIFYAIHSLVIRGQGGRGGCVGGVGGSASGGGRR